MKQGHQARPRVLLVDDDATLRRLVAMMLEEMPIQLLVCASAAQARAVLQQQPVQLLITDWMMPGESGLELLQWLQAHPQHRAQARTVVFSAGLDDLAQRQLEGLDIWRTLAKPVSVLAMEQCVRDALGLGDRPVSVPVPGATADSERAAIRQHFAGNTALFMAFKADCARQMAADISEAESALAGQDAQALRRVSHNLKSVMRSLGREAAAAQAQLLENACAAQDLQKAAGLWPDLRQACRELAAD